MLHYHNHIVYPCVCAVSDRGPEFAEPPLRTVPEGLLRASEEAATDRYRQTGISVQLPRVTRHPRGDHQQRTLRTVVSG